MKLENCLAPSRAADGESGVVIIDWELADIGDPFWDAGGLVQSYYNQWLYSIQPGGPEQPVAEAPQEAREVTPMFTSSVGRTPASGGGV